MDNISFSKLWTYRNFLSISFWILFNFLFHLKIMSDVSYFNSNKGISLSIGIFFVLQTYPEMWTLCCWWVIDVNRRIVSNDTLRKLWRMKERCLKFLKIYFSFTSYWYVSESKFQIFIWLMRNIRISCCNEVIKNSSVFGELEILTKYPNRLTIFGFGREKFYPMRTILFGVFRIFRKIDFDPFSTRGLEIVVNGQISLNLNNNWLFQQQVAKTRSIRNIIIEIRSPWFSIVEAVFGRFFDPTLEFFTIKYCFIHHFKVWKKVWLRLKS